MQIIKNKKSLIFINTAFIFYFIIVAVTPVNAADTASSTDKADSSKKTNTQNRSTTPSTRRRPSSYIGGSVNYLQLHAWLAANDDHKKLQLGPLHGFAPTFRVGDALTEYFSLGFQVQFLIAKTANQQISAFAIMLDASFYPWRGLGIRPSAGFGFSFAQGSNDWEFGFGGPGTLGLALLYEFRISKVMTLAPIVQATLVGSDGYRSLAILFGVEITAWFRKKEKKQ
jgi:hypothetical protein